MRTLDSLIVFILFSAPVAAQPLFDATFHNAVTGAWEDGQYPHDIAVSDLNADGYPDAVIAQALFSGGVRVMMNNGDGTYAEPVLYATEHDAFAVEIADGDGDPDLAFTATDEFQLYVQRVGLLYNDGAGTFGGLTYLQGGPHGANDLVTADFDGDGTMDIATADFGLRRGETVTVILSGGGGSGPTTTSYMVGENPAGLTQVPSGLRGCGAAAPCSPRADPA